VPACAIGRALLLFVVTSCGGRVVHHESFEDHPPRADPGVQGAPGPDGPSHTDRVAGSNISCEGLGMYDPVPLTRENLACSSDEECVRREASCCPTCNPDNIIAIRSHDDGNAFYACCPAFQCPVACEPYEPRRYARCIDGQCRIVSY
jgi:hypothetical protein